MTAETDRTRPCVEEPVPTWAELAESLSAPVGASPARLLLRELRHAPDRLLHPLRRRIALSELRGRRGAASVLFMCVGNIYRSPFAAALFPPAIPEPFRGGFRCYSAGLVGHDRPSPPDAVRAAAERGIDLSSHRSSLFTAGHAAAAELIVVMGTEQKRIVCERFGRSRRDVLVLGDLDPLPIETREIADPWDQPQQVLESSYDRITRCVRELAAAITGMS